jgi:hypothetical protein
MQSLLSITVNGKRRRVVRLAAPEPIPNLMNLSLRYDRWPGPYVLAFRGDYRAGAYVLRPRLLGTAAPGIYRAHAVTIHYTDGTAVESPLLDSIVIDVRELPKRPEHLPTFAAL